MGRVLCTKVLCLGSTGEQAEVFAQHVHGVPAGGDGEQLVRALLCPPLEEGEAGGGIVLWLVIRAIKHLIVQVLSSRALADGEEVTLHHLPSPPTHPPTTNINTAPPTVLTTTTTTTTTTTPGVYLLHWPPPPHSCQAGSLQGQALHLLLCQVREAIGKKTKQLFLPMASRYMIFSPNNFTPKKYVNLCMFARLSL